MKIAVIANPKAAKGRTARRLDHVRGRLEERFGDLEMRFTEHEGHAIEITRELLHAGFNRVIGVGGDGTYNEIANGFIEDGKPVRPEACLGVLPMGTGGDFKRTLRLPSDLDRIIDILVDGVPMEIDLGKVIYQKREGGAGSRYFINITSLGMGGEVCIRSKNFLSPLGGQIAFFYGTLQGFFIYRAKTVDLYLDGEQVPQSYKILNIPVAIGTHHGGGMHVCPEARLDDGILEVTVIEHLGMLTMIKDLNYLYTGNIYEYPKVHHYRVKTVRAESQERVKIEVDGEALGILPVEFSILPRAMKVLVPKDSPWLETQSTDDQ